MTFVIDVPFLRILCFHFFFFSVNFKVIKQHTADQFLQINQHIFHSLSLSFMYSESKAWLLMNTILGIKCYYLMTYFVRWAAYLFNLFKNMTLRWQLNTFNCCALSGTTHWEVIVQLYPASDPSYSPISEDHLLQRGYKFYAHWMALGISYCMYRFPKQSFYCNMSFNTNLCSSGSSFESGILACTNVIIILGS